MGKIKDWFSSLSAWWVLLMFVLVSFVGGEIFDNFCGKKYYNPYANKTSYSVAIREFESICGKGHLEDSDADYAEYSRYYDSRSQAMSAFMLLAHNLNEKYADGKFRHWYVWRNERIYQCIDKNENLIALHFIKRKAGWESFYEIEFYVEKQ